MKKTMEQGTVCATLRTVFDATGLKQAILVSTDGTISEIELTAPSSRNAAPLPGCCVRYRYKRGTTLAQLRKEAQRWNNQRVKEAGVLLAKSNEAMTR